MAALADAVILESGVDSTRLANELLRGKCLPAKAWADAHHIAIASVQGIDYLLTWNFKHLANAHMAMRVVRLCEEAGFRCPKICTPEELVRAFSHERSDSR
jgi:hypothetical protein